MMKPGKTVIRTAFIAFTALVLAGLAPVSVYAEPSKAQLTNVSQNCSTIKQSLVQLQRVDSRTRAYLGSAFESVSGSFIAPLELRLSRNNRSDDRLSQIHTDFVAAQSNFRSAYTNYMRELEVLISVDCSANPSEFYQHLEATRTRRSELHDRTATLRRLTSDQYNATKEFMEKL